MASQIPQGSDSLHVAEITFEAVMCIRINGLLLSENTYFCAGSPITQVDKLAVSVIKESEIVGHILYMSNTVSQFLRRDVNKSICTSDW